MITTVNPFTGEVLNQFQTNTHSEVESIIYSTNADFLDWKKSDIEKRLLFLELLKIKITELRESLCHLMAIEMGKPIRDGKAEVKKCISLCDYYHENLADFCKQEKIKTQWDESYTINEPLGVILGIMPWNYPLWQVMRFAIPTLMARNTVVLKHASSVTQTAIEIEKLFQLEGFSQNLFNVLILKGNAIQEVINNPLIKGVSFTGSTKVGKKIGSLAGESLKKAVLELGGSDAYIITETADLKNAAEKCLESRLLNNGQSCISAKRLIIHNKVYESFKKYLQQAVKSYQLGDPLDENTDLGPMASSYLRDELDDIVKTSIVEGAKVVYQGSIPKEGGTFYPITILENISKKMPLYHEEVFGPVLSLYSYENINDAIEEINNSDYGLGAGIFTENIEDFRSIVEHDIDVGTCCLNDYVKSNPKLPFGGIKNSGFGRELAKAGFTEFTNLKTICVNKD